MRAIRFSITAITLVLASTTCAAESPDLECGPEHRVELTRGKWYKLAPEDGPDVNTCGASAP